MTPHRSLVLLFSILLGASAFAADPAPSATPAATSSGKARPLAPAVDSGGAAPAESKRALLWDSWYVMTIGKNTPFGYYNDRVEKKDGKYAYQNQLWKLEEGFINQERVVSFGQDDENITPLLFNFLATYRESEFAIDGTFSGKNLSVKARRGKENLKPLSVQVPSKTFLSTLFQVWIGKRLATLQPGKRLSFTTLFEDALDSRYSTVVGSAVLEAEDEFAKKTGTKKLKVDLSNTKTTWYVLPTGEAVRIEKPDQKLLIERKTEAEARRHLVKRSE